MTTIDERIIQKQDEYIKALEEARVKDKELHKAELKATTKLYKGAVAHVAAERDFAVALAESYKEDVQHWQSLHDREHAAFEQAAADRDQAIKDKSVLRRRLHSVRDQYAHAAEALELKQQEYNIVVKELEKSLTKQASLEEDVRNWSTAYDELQSKLGDHMELAVAFIDHICEMVACDAELSDIADECMLWRKGKWASTGSIEDLVGGIIDEDPGSFFGGDSGAPVEDLVEDLQAEDQRRGDPYDAYKWKVLVVEHQGDEAVFTGFFADYDLARESVDLMVARGCYEAWVEELL